MAVIPRTRVATVSFRIFACGWFRRSAGGRKLEPDRHSYKAAQVLTRVIAFDIKGAICHFTQSCRCPCHCYQSFSKFSLHLNLLLLLLVVINHIFRQFEGFAQLGSVQSHQLGQLVAEST